MAVGKWTIRQTIEGETTVIQKIIRHIDMVSIKLYIEKIIL